MIKVLLKVRIGINLGPSILGRGIANGTASVDKASELNTLIAVSRIAGMIRLEGAGGSEAQLSLSPQGMLTPPASCN